MSHSQQPSEQPHRVDQAIAEYMEAIDAGSPLDQNQWLAQYDDIRSQLLDFLTDEQALGHDLSDACKMPGAGQDALAETHVVPGSALSTDSEIPSAQSAGESVGASSPKPLPSEQRKPTDRRRIGPYTLKRMLGAGGMGQVFEAADPSGNAVALKLLSPRWTQSAESLERFRQEGKIASTINHPRCVFVKAADEDNGQPYIVMELMSGRTLRDLKAEHDHLPIADAVRATLDVLEGLEEAHSHGMIHRDIKPANCYLEANGRVKVGDFGLARSVVSDSELTQTGDFIGTPLFASPEQVKGQAIDIRTDIYSVCATLYYLLTGKAPFAGSSPTSVIAKIVSEDPQSIRELNPQVPVLLERIVMRGLQRDRNARFQSISEMRDALEPFVSGRYAIAAWGRRFAATSLDSLITGLLGGIVAFVLPVSSDSLVIPFGTYVTLTFPVVSYYLIFEGWKNASPGKWLLQLHIVNQSDGERPTHRRLVLRTIFGMLLMGFGSDLLIYAVLDSTQSEARLALQWLGYLSSYLVILSPLLLTRRGRLLLHDQLSGTMVVDRPQVNLQQQLAIRAADYHPPLLAATGYPAQLGQFTVAGLVSVSDQTAILAAHDAKLERDIWLHLQPEDTPEPTAARRNCARTSRLRWLTGGYQHPWRWDAYAACQGAPLKHWTATESTLTWKTTRGLLVQLIEEIHHSALDQTQLKVQSMDQIWLDNRGRLSVIDWSPTNATIQLQGNRTNDIIRQNTPDITAQISPADPVDPLASTRTFESTKATGTTVLLNVDDCSLLTETARLALCGTCQPLLHRQPDGADPVGAQPDGKTGPGLPKPVITPIAAIIPSHASDLLHSLTNYATTAISNQSQQTGKPDAMQKNRPRTDALLTQLESSSKRPSEANLEHRFLGLGVAAFFVLALIGLIASVARIGNQLAIARACDMLIAPAAADWLLNSDEGKNYDLAASQQADFPNRAQLQSWLDHSDQSSARAAEEYQVRLAGMGSFSRSVALATGLAENPTDQLPTVSFEWRGSELWAVNWPKTDKSRLVPLTLLTKLATSDSDITPLQLLDRSVTSILTRTAVPLLLWMIWAGLARGGISMWVSGLQVVRSDGRRMTWLQSFSRSALMVMPMLLLVNAIIWIDLHHLDMLWLSVLLYQVLLGLFVAYAIFTIAFPRRAPHDWLLGTYLIPR